MLFPMQNIVDSLQARTGSVRLRSGCLMAATTAPARASRPSPCMFRSDAALLQAFTRGQIGLLESYFDQSVDVEGDFGAALAAGLLSGLDMHGKALITMENGIHELRYSNHSLAQAKANARAHYGLGDAFYRLWLDDPLMMYTCGYWPEGTQTLEQAQQRKIDHVCRKIQLARGERFVDIGCGFGGFMFRAWETLGAIGTGINTTTEQVDWLRSEITRRRPGRQAQRARGRLPRGRCPVRQGGVDRRARTCRA